jgi:hypothetical protein
MNPMATKKINKNGAAKTTKKKYDDESFFHEIDKCRDAGLTVMQYDAPHDFLIQITQEDIDLAARKDPKDCALGRGICRSSPAGVFTCVGKWTTKILYPKSGEIYRFETPKAIRDAIKTFDATGQWGLPPGTYILKSPRGSTRLTKNQEPHRRELNRKRWVRFRARAKNSQTNGNGLGVITPRPLHRQIAACRVAAG